MSAIPKPAAQPLLFRSAGEDVAEIWRQPPPEPIPSGIEPLDRALNGGFMPESLAVLCAGTGRGKTGLVVQIALSWLALGRTVLFIETEMSKRQIYARCLAQIMGQPWIEVFRMGQPSADTLANVARRDLQGLYLVRWDRSQEIGKILDNRPQSPSGPPLVILDQISDVARASENADMRIATARVTGNLKSLAEQHKTVVLAVSQTARFVTAQQRQARGGRDFEGAAKDAGEVETDAATVLYLESEPCPREGFCMAQLHIAKSRGGSCNEVIRLRFHGAVGQFEPDTMAELTADQRRVLDAIAALVGSTGYASVPKLKAELSMGQTLLSRLLGELVKTGHIHREARGIRLVNIAKQP